MWYTIFWFIEINRRYLMKRIRLGMTGLEVTRPAFGALPIQRCSKEYAVELLRKAYEGGINYFDTANAYTDSEEKIGTALSDVRENIIISTKSGGKDKNTVSQHIQMSLERLQTNYIDIFQFHMASEMPDVDDPDGIYSAAIEAKKKGYIRHIGITAHRLDAAFKFAESGVFETLQFPISYLSNERELELVRLCKDSDIGFIAMKGLAGGMLSDARPCHAFMETIPNIVPIWGIQTLEQLAQWLELAKTNPTLDDELMKIIEKDKAELGDGFCRGCGYCLPCPADIAIPTSMRMKLFLTRAPWKPFMSDEWYEKMHRIENCIECGQCMKKCPYELKIPEMLKHMLADYDKFYETHAKG